MKEIIDAKLAAIAVPDELHGICSKTIGNIRRQRIRKITAAAAAIVCVCVIPVMASGLYGHYEEVRRGTAITGGIIVEADNDFVLTASVDGDNGLQLTVELLNTEENAYRYNDEFWLNEVVIKAVSGEIVYSADDVALDKWNAVIDTELIPGEYIIEVNGMTAYSKGDALLPIQGEWQCPLTVK